MCIHIYVCVCVCVRTERELHTDQGWDAQSIRRKERAPALWLYKTRRSSAVCMNLGTFRDKKHEIMQLQS